MKVEHVENGDDALKVLGDPPQQRDRDQNQQAKDRFHDEHRDRDAQHQTRAPEEIENAPGEDIGQSFAV